MRRPSKVGDLCKSWSGEWFMVVRVGPRGGCDGPCVYGARSFMGGNFRKLRSTTWMPDKVPDEVLAAVAVRALIGKVPS